MLPAPDRDACASQPKHVWIAPAPEYLQSEESRVREPTGRYPPSTEAIREWFRRTYGREPSDFEVGELERKLSNRQDAEADAATRSEKPVAD